MAALKDLTPTLDAVRGYATEVRARSALAKLFEDVLDAEGLSVSTMVVRNTEDRWVIVLLHREAVHHLVMQAIYRNRNVVALGG